MRLRTRCNYLFFIIVSCFVFLLPSSVFAATTVTSISQNTTNVGRYTKFELTFPISRQFPAGSFLPYYFYDPSDTPSQYPGRNSPYGVDGISIDAVFTSPSGKVMTAPAFYFQDYIRSGDTMTPTSNYSWKVRFAPKEIGNYSYYLTVKDKTGTSRYPETGNLQFTATASFNKGFVRVSPRDSRFLEFENGESFIPNSSGRQYWRNGKRSSFYEQSFAEFKQYGVNFTRIWDQNDGYGLTVEGHFDAYKWPDDYKPDTDAIAAALPKGTQMNQRGNYDEDIIIESARQNGVYIELSSKGEPYWIWDASVYDEGWNPNPVRFDNLQHLNYWKRNYRYRIARWGYATSIATWEVWNEHGHISPGSETWNFYTELAKYIKDTDPYDHLVTTSQGSQAWSPAFWSTPGMDVVNYHDYMMPGRYDNVYDAADFVYRFMQCLRMTNGSTCGLSLGDGSNASGPQKPIIWGELDTGTSSWNEPNPQQKATHAMRWAGLFSPGGTTGIDWYWDSQSASFMATKHAEAKIASDFFKDIDYAGKKFTYLSTNDVKLSSETVQTTNSLLRVLAMRAQNNSEAYAWVQNKNNARWDQGINTTPISASFTLNGMTQGTYTIQTWDTYSGQITTSTIQANNSSITIPVTNLSKDIALKITTGQISTVTPTAQIKIGDANNDGKVDGRDYIVWLNNYGSSTTIGPNKGDFNSSGRIDGVDYILWLNNYGM